jgi:hypothetical protein
MTRPARGVAFGEPPKDTHDALPSLEITDAGGYVLFFGRPSQAALPASS